MSDPSRWLDPSSGAPEGARDLLAHAPRMPALSAEAKSRLASRIAAATTGGAAAGASAWIWKGLFGAGVIGLASVAFVVANHTRVPPTRVQAPGTNASAPALRATAEANRPGSPASAPASVQPEALTVPTVPAITPPPSGAFVSATAPTSSRHAGTHAAVDAHSAAPRAVGGPVDDDPEWALLSRAQWMTRGDPAAALAILHQVAVRFPTGRWIEERERATVVALARAGRNREARARGDAFLRSYPNSVYATPVRDLLRTLP